VIDASQRVLAKLVRVPPYRVDHWIEFIGAVDRLEGALDTLAPFASPAQVIRAAAAVECVQALREFSRKMERFVALIEDEKSC
jgi:hypothetical protein